jgi:hypothetical protein
MADLDYTNIAGSPFQPYVADQIERRKDLVYNELRTPDQLQWLTNKNVWIRVSSGANVLYGSKTYDGLEGDALSKKYILQGGVLSHPTADEYNLRYGVGEDNAYGLKPKSNDSTRPANFGNIPMPGITNISVKTGGKLGTLKETTIDFMCYSIEQLNIMEALYMKLGFGLLVEWGHTFFINNDNGKVESNIQPLPFYGIHTKEDLMEKITENRKNYSGNYDATWGTIKNFSYSLTGNGAFKCQTQLVGAGDILESLKVNVSGKFNNQSTSEKDKASKNVANNNVDTGSMYPVIADANLSLLNDALYDIFKNNVINENNVESSFLDYSTLYVSWLDSIYNNYNTSISNFSSNPELVRKGYNYRLLNTPGMNASTTGNIDTKVPEIDPFKFFARFIMGYEINGDELNNNDVTKPGLEQVYITLGHFLFLLNQLGMIYDRPASNKKTEQKPHIYIDVNPETNRCYTFPGHISLDPSICLIGSEKLPFGISSDIFSQIQSHFPFYGSNKNAPGMGDAELGGKFMYTLVNINWIASLLQKWRANDTKGNVYFVDLVKDILDGISKATGGYNEFRIVPDDDSRCIRILDDRRTVDSNQPIPDYTEIPVLGTKSIVYDFSYTSKISPNTAAMVVVAAQAQPYGVQGAENALAFSHLNKGLYNRLGTVKVDSATDLNQAVSTNNDTEQRYIELRTYVENIYNGTGGAKTETETAAAESSKQQAQYAGVSGGGTGFSDIRLKNNIKLVNVIDELNIYSYNYIWDSETLYEGVIAQELLDTKYSEAVILLDSGYYVVDYSKLPVSLKIK